MPKKLSKISARILPEQREYLERAAERCMLPTDSGPVLSRALQALISWAMDHDGPTPERGQRMQWMLCPTGGAA